MNELTCKLIDYQLPAARLPLSDERRPFQHLPIDLVALVAERALSCPERRGRLTDAVREIAGQSAPTDQEFVVFEAHIDLTEMDSDLNLGLISLGFEPDDFAKMEPPEYVHHYTVQYVASAQSTQLGVFQGLVADAAREAARLIDQHDRATGYVEIETYRSKYLQRFSFQEFSPSSTMSAPVRSSFQLRHVPVSQKEAVESGLPLEARRAADIHVKIPGGFAEHTDTPGFERVRIANEHCTPGRAWIRDTLATQGFYEIVSEAGNYLYSAHFADLSEANCAYWELAEFARRFGGITGVVREACTSVWRKRVMSDGIEVLAKVPPLLRTAWPDGTRQPLQPL